MRDVLTNRQPFVLFPLGRKRFALPAEQVSELARQDAAQTFPHTTPLITGVVLRRNHVIPVADVAAVLVGLEAPARKFYLVVNRDQRSQMAIPVTGECELADAEQLPVTGKLPAYVSGLLSLSNEIVEVLDLDRLLATEVRG